MGWSGRAHSGILVRNPIGWLLTHVNSNFALFKDNGTQILESFDCSSKLRKDKNFLIVAERLCNFYGASLTLLHIVPPSFSKKATKKMAEKSASLLSGLKTTADLKVVVSEDPLNSIASISSEYDLLILGAPEKDSWISLLLGTGRDKFTESSACSVLRITMKN